MAHRLHSIPWHILVEHFKVKPTTWLQCKKFLGPFVSHWPRNKLNPREKPDQKPQLEHFLRCFTRTIGEFSTTERARYPSNIRALRTGSIGGVDFWNRYKAMDANSPPLIRGQVDYAINIAREMLKRPLRECFEGDIALSRDKMTVTIKAVLDADEMEKLLGLA